MNSIELSGVKGKGSGTFFQPAENRGEDAVGVDLDDEIEGASVTVVVVDSLGVVHAGRSGERPRDGRVRLRDLEPFY